MLNKGKKLNSIGNDQNMGKRRFIAFGATLPVGFHHFAGKGYYACIFSFRNSGGSLDRFVQFGRLHECE